MTSAAESSSTKTTNDEVRFALSSSSSSLSNQEIRFVQCGSVQDYITLINDDDENKDKDVTSQESSSSFVHDFKTTVLPLLSEPLQSSSSQEQRFVIFELCPTPVRTTTPTEFVTTIQQQQQQQQESSVSCNKYMIDLELYVHHTSKMLHQDQDWMCEKCRLYCRNEVNNNNNDFNNILLNNHGGTSTNMADIDCSTCHDECSKFSSMEANGYVDATEFGTNCQLIYENGDGEGDNNNNSQRLYAGPICTHHGTKIQIGVFADEDCAVIMPTKHVDDYVQNNDGYGMKLSYALLKQSFVPNEDDSVTDCVHHSSMELYNKDAFEESTTTNNNDNSIDNGSLSVQEISSSSSSPPPARDECTSLYDDAAKCEVDSETTSKDGVNSSYPTTQVCNVIDTIIDMTSTSVYHNINNGGSGGEDKDNNNGGGSGTDGSVLASLLSSKERTHSRSNPSSSSSSSSSNEMSPFFKSTPSSSSSSSSASSSATATSTTTQSIVTMTQKDLLMIFGLAMVILTVVVIRLLGKIRAARNQGLLPSTNPQVNGEQYELVTVGGVGDGSGNGNEQEQQHDDDGDEDVVVS